MNKKMFGLYVIINIDKNNKSYIGFTGQLKQLKNGSISNDRIRQHKHDLKHNKHTNFDLQQDFNNNDRFIFQTIIIGTETQCKKQELKMIKSGLYKYNKVGRKTL